jgi:hypothetical protein
LFVGSSRSSISGFCISAAASKSLACCHQEKAFIFFSIEAFRLTTFSISDISLSILYVSLSL